MTKDKLLYFIQAKDTNYIKIGVSGCPKRRMSLLQVGCPFELKLIATLAQHGSITEGELHTRFRDLRVRGEWFKLEGSLLKFVSNIPDSLEKKVTERPTVRADVFGSAAQGWWAELETPKTLLRGPSRHKYNHLPTTMAAIWEVIRLAACTHPIPNMEVVVGSPKEYVIETIENAINRKWLWKWSESNWRYKSGDPVSHQLIWRSILGVLDKHQISLVVHRGTVAEHISPTEC